jgi:hypothetical protein
MKILELTIKLEEENRFFRVVRQIPQVEYDRVPLTMREDFWEHEVDQLEAALEVERAKWIKEQ